MASLMQLIEDLGDQIVKLPLGEQRTKLAVQQEELEDQLDVLVATNVSAATTKYLEATAKLDAANKALVAAHEDVKKVAATITQIAEVIDLLAQLAANVK